MDYETKAIPFDEVYKKEWEEIQERRLKQLYDGAYSDDAQADGSTPPDNLVGLALSGGGIRSATFCLGFLQGLHKLNLLRIFDYLSTVSGGGYVGGWWSAWLMREELSTDATGRPIEDDFTPTKLRPEDVKHPESLIIKLRNSEDNVSNALRERLSYGTSRLLSFYKEGGSIHDRDALIKNIVEEINRAIDQHFLFTPLWCDVGGEKTLDYKTYPAIQDLSPEKYALWVNRLLVDEAYPYELKGLFPGEEKIESQRALEGMDEIDEEDHRETEGSLSAWKDPIHHLRLFASYLTPRRGALSADTWRAVSVFTRNLTLTWMVLLPVLMAIVLVGQLYFQIIPHLTRPTFGNISPERLKFISLLLPMTALLGWIAVMAITWLLLSRDKFSVNGFIVHLACIFALLTLLIGGVIVFVDKEQISPLFSDSSIRLGLGLWAGIGLVMLVKTLWPLLLKATGKNNPELKNGWYRQVLRNRISRTHTKLMTWMVLIFIVLLVSGYGPSIINWIINLQAPGFKWLGALPAVAAIAGSIFTALKASPSGGADARQMREPSFFTRFIFAVTPGLMVILLAIIAAWAGERLFNYIHVQSQYQTIRPFIALAILYGILLCFALAVYEMEWVELKLSWPLSIFSCLVALNFYWVGTEVVGYAGNNELQLLEFISVEGEHRLILIPVILAVVPIILFFRILGNGRWKQSFRKLSEFRQRPLRVLASLLPLFFIIAFLVFTYLIHKSGRYLGLFKEIYPLMTLVAALGGSLLLFRLVVVRKDEPAPHFRLRTQWRGKKATPRSQNLWWLPSLCLVIPLIMLGCLHVVLLTNHESLWREISITTIFILSVATLPYFLLRLSPSASATSVRVKAKRSETGADTLKNFLNTLVIDKQHNSLLAFVCAGIGAALALGFTLNTYGRPYRSELRAGVVELPAIMFASIFSLVLFELSLIQSPLAQSARVRPATEFGKSRSSWLERVPLWALITSCGLIAAVVGYLSNVILFHFRDIIVGDPASLSLMPSQPLASLALAGLVTCCAVIGFEIWWGKGNNRRSVWLLACTYVVLFALFMIGLILDYEQSSPITMLLTVFGLLAAVMVWVVALGWMVDPNMVSMHQFYKGRLARAYLGASNVRRFHQNKDIAESVAGDDVQLAMLRNCQRGGPYHLINTTLNLVAGRDLATAQRSACSFVLSQRYCGSMRTSYRPTSQYMGGRLTLGTAVATSGAAVSPSMGAKKPTAALAMLMTLLNVRLGYWAPTPNREKWRLSQPRLWPFYLLREFLSQTNDLSSYCYLTDGGHFDNTGLYSLVERGCRFIVMIDCAADPKPCFQDLGDAIRRCRIDFGTEIELDIEPFIKTNQKVATQHLVCGKIIYSRKHANELHWKINQPEESEAHREARTGIIIYFKPSIVGKETADIRQYAIENNNFPQQTTANQWFDEAQFESYRRLGQLCVEKAFKELKAVRQVKNRAALMSQEVKAIFKEAAEEFGPKDRPRKITAKKDLPGISFITI